MGGWEVFGVRVYVYNNKIIYCGIAFMRYYNRFFSLLGKTPVHKIGADKRKRKQKCLTHMRNSTTTPPPLTEIRTLLLYYYDLRTWRKHKNLAVFQRSPGHDHTHVSNPPPTRCRQKFTRAPPKKTTGEGGGGMFHATARHRRRRTGATAGGQCVRTTRGGQSCTFRRSPLHPSTHPSKQNPTTTPSTLRRLEGREEDLRSRGLRTKTKWLR